MLSEKNDGGFLRAWLLYHQLYQSWGVLQRNLFSLENMFSPVRQLDFGNSLIY